MKYRPPGVGPGRPSMGVNPNSLSTFPTAQKPVSETEIDVAAKAMIANTHRGCPVSAPSAENASRNSPAISQTVRSMYQSIGRNDVDAGAQGHGHASLNTVQLPRHSMVWHSSQSWRMARPSFVLWLSSWQRKHPVDVVWPL